MLFPLLAASALLAIVDARSVPTSSSFSSVKWSNCTITLPSPGFDCGTLEVPIDWDNPSGAKVQLGMLRHKASKPSRRIGSLLFNPGGPGDSAAVYVAAGSTLFGQDITDRFDIVGLDPRGVGLSSPIQCDPELYNQRVSSWPSNQTELDSLVQKFQKLGESCLNMTGPLVKHMDSISVAKDMEAIRQGLGDEKLNYIGLSYGTLIGQTYAELFPENIRTMVFDGNMDHSTDPISYLTVKTFTYESELIRFADWCSQSKVCPLNGTSSDVLKVFDDLVKQANKSPIPAPSCKTSGCRENVNGEEIQNNLNSLLFVKSGLLATWTKLGQYLLEAKQGNATGLSTTIATSSKSDSFASDVISCSDWYHPEASLVDLKDKRDLARTLWPHVGTGDYGLNRCIGWPFPQVNKQRRANIHGTPRLLLVNSQFDPSCSYIWANGLQEQIENSTLLTRRGDGHTSYVLHGETWGAVNAYIANLTIPADNTVLNS
ncbi:hypothetical protein N7541_008344 [Penicillium brevicompactum]|uniref:AB hydrolase-1 domain-containing protein n=1 Tax=Penicillium brevicompactum TaxID=5074 RepID=A0A9W9QYT4_PENBR|nr:hypothetical protein N7541_008344 [Penicillium brevicompactum]